MQVRPLLPAPRRRKLCIACGDFYALHKKHRALTPLLLLSKSNPLRWASIWFPLRAKHRSVSALRRKLHYVSSFFLTNSSQWETGSDYLLCPLSAQPKPGAAVRARECRKVFFRTMQRCFFHTTALLEIEGGQTLLVPARLYGF